MSNTRTQTDYKEFATMTPPDEDSIVENLTVRPFVEQPQLSSRIKQLAIVNVTFLITIEIARFFPFMVGYLPVFHIGQVDLPSLPTFPAFLVPVWNALATMWSAFVGALSCLWVVSLPFKLVKLFSLYVIEVVYNFSAALSLPSSVSSLSIAIFVIASLIEVITFFVNKPLKRQNEMQVRLQPQLNLLKAKYSNDREKLVQEQMKLYREVGINPIVGCLPLIILLPLGFGVFGAIQEFVLGQIVNAAEPLFWIPNLIRCEPSRLCDEAYSLLPIPIPFLTLLYLTLYWDTTRIKNAEQSMGHSMGKGIFFLSTIPFMRMPSAIIYYLVIRKLALLCFEYVTSSGASDSGFVVPQQSSHPAPKRRKHKRI